MGYRINPKIIFSLGLVFLFSLSGIITAEEIKETEANAQVNLSLEERLNLKVSLDLRNIDVLEALKFLAEKGNLNIVPTRNVTGRVTLNLQNVSIKDIFDLILRSNGLAYVREKDIFYVMNEAEYKATYGKPFFDVRQVKVFRLKYSIPEQAFSLMDALKSEIGRVLVDQESGNVLLMDTPEHINRIEEALEEFEKRNIIEVFDLKYAKAKDVEEILKTRIDFKKVGMVKADERNNQVIVQTFADRMQEVRDLIRYLDEPTREVLIETKIVKIKLSNQMDKGLEWEGIFEMAKKYGTSYFGSYPFSNIVAGSTTPTFSTRKNVLDSLGGSIASYPFSGTTANLAASQKVSPGEKMHLGIIDDDRDFDLLINYLKTLGDTKVISNPKIVVADSQEARIHIGERQAYVTTTTTTGQTTSTISEEVQFVDVGIQLAVTPRINKDGFVTMKLKPEISNVASILITPTGNRIPIIDTVMAETTVMIKDGTTLLLAGLRKEDKILTSEGVPLLSSIPFVGNLFKKEQDKTERTELLVMITPHIIKGTELTTADSRAFGEKLVNDYQDYPALEPIKKENKEKEEAGGIKPYREEENQSVPLDNAKLGIKTY